MTQNSPVAFVDTESGTQLVARLNNVGESFRTVNRGTARPAYAVAGTEWWDSDTPTATLNQKKVYDGAADAVEGFHDTAGDRYYPALHKNAIHGLKMSNNGADALNDIDIATGSARDSTDVDDLHLLAAITKRLDAAWVVGTNQGGIDTGAKAATTMYAVWLIKRSDTGVVDALFSTSFTAPTMPASYDRKRLIGSVVTDATPNIIAYTQAGDYFRYTGDVIQDISDATITSDTFETGTVSVPPSCLAHLYTLNSNPTATNSPGRIVVRTVGAADAPNTDSENFASIETSGTFDHVAATGWVLTNASRQIEYAASEGTGSSTVTIRTIGFTMLTRTNP